MGIPSISHLYPIGKLSAKTYVKLPAAVSVSGFEKIAGVVPPQAQQRAVACLRALDLYFITWWRTTHES